MTQWFCFIESRFPLLKLSSLHSVLSMSSIPIDARLSSTIATNIAELESLSTKACAVWNSSVKSPSFRSRSFQVQFMVSSENFPILKSGNFRKPEKKLKNWTFPKTRPDSAKCSLASLNPTGRWLSSWASSSTSKADWTKSSVFPMSRPKLVLKKWSSMVRISNFQSAWFSSVTITDSVSKRWRHYYVMDQFKILTVNLFSTNIKTGIESGFVAVWLNVCSEDTCCIFHIRSFEIILCFGFDIKSTIFFQFQ